MEVIILIILRLLAACIFAAGSVLLAYDGKSGWGWCIFAAIILGVVTIESKTKD